MAPTDRWSPNIRETFRHKLRNEWTKTTAFGHSYVLISELKRWMTSVEPGQTKNNTVLLLEDIYGKSGGTFFYTGSNSILEGSARSLKVFSMLLDLGYGHLLGEFTNARIIDDQLHLFPSHRDRLRVFLESKRIPNVEQILEGFEQRRRQFCPAIFESGSCGTYDDLNWVLPFAKHEPINEKGGTAEVSQVAIQEGFFSNPVKAKRFEEPGLGWCYELAIKTYNAKNLALFQQEVDAFQGLQDQSGIVGYLGHYVFDTGSDSKPGGDPKGTTYNLILEYGESDLDEYFAQNHPPVLALEIISFWEALFKVGIAIQKMHNLEFRNSDGIRSEFHGWHADVKPDNILNVHGEFKLADFGFSTFQGKSNGIPKGCLNGGTETFGPPECDHANRGEGMTFDQTIDVWSFGAVLSVAATWVILGPYGIEQYEAMRMREIAALYERRKQDAKIRIPSARDAFHDGAQVLPGVLEWHRYLRLIARKSDPISGFVLDRVDNMMLVGNPQDRSSSKKVSEALAELVFIANETEQGRTGLSPSFLSGLLECEEVKSQHGSEMTKTGATETYRNQRVPVAEGTVENAGGLDPPPIFQVRKSKRIGKSKRLEVNLPSRTAHRTEIFKPTVGSLNHDMGTEADDPHIPFSENQVGYNDFSPPHMEGQYAAPQQRASQLYSIRENEPNGVYYSRNQPSSFSPVPDPLPLGPTRSSYGHYTPGSYTDFRNMMPYEPSYPIAGNTQQSLGMSEGQPNFEPMVGSPRPQRSYTQSTVQGGERGWRSLARSSGYNVSEDCELVRVWEELDREKRSGNPISRFFGTGTKPDEYLMHHIQNRDMVFVVDTAASMREFWEDVSFACLTLTMKLAGLDKDGLDLIFTGNQSWNVRNAEFKAAERFKTALGRAKPKQLRHGVPAIETDMATTLGEIFDEYLKNDRRKRMTLLVLTNGRWERNRDDRLVEETIADFVKKLNKEGRTEKRRFTIQFISFGSDPTAIERLRSLDDELEREYNIPDIVDTEPWTGGVLKMLMGSFRPEIDQAGSLASPISLTSSTENDPSLRHPQIGANGHPTAPINRPYGLPSSVFTHQVSYSDPTSSGIMRRMSSNMSDASNAPTNSRSSFLSRFRKQPQ